MNKKKKIYLIVGIVILLFPGIYFYFQNTTPPNLPLSREEKIQGDNLSFTATQNESVYEFISDLQNEGKINFTEKNYAGIGKFIESINGVKGSGEQNWIYYVNGEKAQVGVSNYKIKPGDIVSWKYEKLLSY